MKTLFIRRKIRHVTIEELPQFDYIKAIEEYKQHLESYCLDCRKILTKKELRVHENYDSKYHAHSKSRIIQV